MKITGYSERGIVNTLFYEILYSVSPKLLLEKFISNIKFPFIDQPEFFIKDVEIFIEQSFSDFGDADALMFMSTETSRVSIFFEAKVKTDSIASWAVDDEYIQFRNGIKKGKIDSSNLFNQLYHKVRLAEELRLYGIPKLQLGIEFPQCSSKK